jgi:cytosine/adenosine deaminase-related metal-dependent hydrolase
MILSARWVIPVNSTVVENGAIVVEGDKIVDYGRFDRLRHNYPDHSIRDFGDAAILPGFVNVHSHLELSILRGYLEDLPFWDWIRRLTQAKYEVLNREDLLVSALLGAVEAILSGITTVGDPMDLGTSLDAVLETGLRGVLYQEVFSPRPEESDTALSALNDKMCLLQNRIRIWGKNENNLYPTGLTRSINTEFAAMRKGRVSLGVSPHAPYTVSAPLIRKVHALAQSQGLPVCIHIAESQDETQFIEQGAGPIKTAWQQRGIAWSAPGCTPIEYLHRLGVIGENTLLVHCIRLGEGDLKILQTARPSIAHCPRSNWKLRHGSADLKGFFQAGLRVGLGTDSVASNNNMDFFEEMRAAFFNPSWSYGSQSEGTSGPSSVAAADILRMATVGGAEALGLDSQIGSIEKGKQADLIVVDLSQVHSQPVFSPVTTLVFSACASDVRMTMIGGEILTEERKVLGLSLAALSREIEKVRDKLAYGSK